MWGVETLTASDINGEFNNILNSALSLISPLTGTLDWDGYAHTLDAAAATTVQSTAALAWTFTPGAKTGTPGTTGAVSNWAANTYTDNNTAGSGTATAYAAHAFQRPTLAASNATVTTTDATTVYIANSPANGTNETVTNPWSLWVDAGNVRLDGDLRVDTNLRATAALGYYIQGLTYDNGTDATNDININIGMATSSNAAQANRRTMTLATALGKQSDVGWAVGGTTAAPAGGLDTGAVGNNDYYIHLIMRSDTSVVDALFSLSATAPTMPTSYDYRRLIGWFKRVGGTIVAFTTYETCGGGLELMWTTPTLDVSLAATLTTNERSDAVKVPLNFSTIAHLNVVVNDVAANNTTIVYCPDQSDLTPSRTAANLQNLWAPASVEDSAAFMHIRTSATGTISARSTITVDNYYVSTFGFTWARRN